MTDPIYEYVKGEGWVPRSSVIVTLGCGTTVRLEKRNPEPGEKFGVFPSMVRLEEYLIDIRSNSRDYRYSYYSIACSKPDPDSQYFYITLVPV